MLLLTSTSNLIRLITGSAGTIKADYSYVDNASGTFTAGGAVNGVISTATTTTIVAAPASSTQRNIKQLTVANMDASVANLCEIQEYDGTTAITHWKGTLQAGERVDFDETGGWTYYASDGTVKLATLSPDIQVFTASGTWTKPTSFTPKVVVIRLYGAGGGGGAGASLGRCTRRGRCARR